MPEPLSPTDTLPVPRTPQSDSPASSIAGALSSPSSNVGAASSPTTFSLLSVSKEGSMKSITTKIEQGIPVKFAIPSSWRADIMEGISSSNLKPTVRNALVRDLVVHMYSFGSRPSKKFCSFVAKRLILKYPSLRDACGTGYVSIQSTCMYLHVNTVFICEQASWEQKITERVYNVQKGCKKKDEAPPASKRPRIDQGRYPPLDEDSLPDDTTYSRHIAALEKELGNKKPRAEALQQLMELTFVTRHKFVMEDASSARQIIEKFPVLKMPDIVSTCVCVRVCVCVCVLNIVQHILCIHVLTNCVTACAHVFRFLKR